MKSSLNTRVRRCRVHLGTFVEISASGDRAAEIERIINEAFQVVERIHNRLSIHQPESELARVNATAYDGAVKVSDEIYRVLSYAATMASESNGAFDHTVAPHLVAWGLLPTHLQKECSGTWKDVELLPGNEVRYLRPLTVDLGGIAKGYAVDQAIEVLRGSDYVNSAIVNAGGDLRVFGSDYSLIHLRSPISPGSFARTLQVCDQAVATSAPTFSEREINGEKVSHLVNARRGKAITGNISVTVCAPECWLADALTKVVLIDPDKADAMLTKYNAQSIVLGA